MTKTDYYAEVISDTLSEIGASMTTEQIRRLASAVAAARETSYTAFAEPKSAPFNPKPHPSGGVYRVHFGADGTLLIEANDSYLARERALDRKPNHWGTISDIVFVGE